MLRRHSRWGLPLLSLGLFFVAPSADGQDGGGGGDAASVSIPEHASSFLSDFFGPSYFDVVPGADLMTGEITPPDPSAAISIPEKASSVSDVTCRCIPDYSGGTFDVAPGESLVPDAWASCGSGCGTVSCGSGCGSWGGCGAGCFSCGGF